MTKMMKVCWGMTSICLNVRVQASFLHFFPHFCSRNLQSTYNHKYTLLSTSLKQLKYTHKSYGNASKDMFHLSFIIITQKNSHPSYNPNQSKKTHDGPLVPSRKAYNPEYCIGDGVPYMRYRVVKSPLTLRNPTSLTTRVYKHCECLHTFIQDITSKHLKTFKLIRMFKSILINIYTFILEFFFKLLPCDLYTNAPFVSSLTFFHYSSQFFANLTRLLQTLVSLAR